MFYTDRDGTYGDPVNTAGGTDAFSPGFCNGAATGTANAGCRNEKDGAEYFGRLGYDKRMGNFVLGAVIEGGRSERSEEHTSEFQSLMRISYAVFCLKKKNKK